MLEYEWGNPSTMILAGYDGGAATQPDETRRQFFDHNNYTFVPDHYLPEPRHVPYTPATTGFSHNHHNHVFDTRAFTGASPTSFSPLPSSSLFSLDPIPPVNASHCGLGPQDVGRPVDFVGRALGLNLGGRTYFATSNDDNLVNRLYRGPKAVEPGSSANSPRCQAEGCNVDLSDAKHYHRRHKVCEFHSKASTVLAGGLTQRFCQQCSRFHLLSEFDNGKRSCRRRLADHNRRRRKLQQATQEIQKSHLTLDNVTSSSPDSGNDQSSPAVLVKVSPPDYFRQKPYRIRDSSTTSGLTFFSNE